MKTGRPKIIINMAEMVKLCAMQCTEVEIADWFSCSVDTIENRIKQEYKVTFSEFYTKHRAKGKVALRRNMFNLSSKSPAMAIFLAKNWLGMKDTQEIEGTLNQNIKQEIDVKVVNFNSKEVSDAFIEAIKLGLDTTLLGGNGHSEDASVLPTQADIQTTPVPESKN